MSPSSLSSFTVSSQVNSTDYRCLVITASPGVMSFPSTTVTVTNAYCAPVAINCGLNDLIHNFILVGEGGTQINNPNTGCAAGSYDNRTSTSVTLYEGRTYTVQVNSLYSSSQYFSMWLDFNANFQFETTERVANILLVGTSNNAVPVVIPTIAGGATIGARRMRATVGFAVTPSPCHTGTSYGESHDYTVNIAQSKLRMPCSFVGYWNRAEHQSV